MSHMIPDTLTEIKILKGEANKFGLPFSFRYKNGCVIKLWATPKGIMAITVYDKNGERMIDWNHTMPQELEWPEALPPLNDLFEGAMEAMVTEMKEREGVRKVH